MVEGPDRDRRHVPHNARRRSACRIAWIGQEPYVRAGITARNLQLGDQTARTRGGGGGARAGGLAKRVRDATSNADADQVRMVCCIWVGKLRRSQSRALLKDEQMILADETTGISKA